MELKIKKIHPDAQIPHYAHPSDAGLDLYVPERVTLLPGERKSVPLGLALEIPEGFVGLLWDKSGPSHIHGIKTFGGVIDKIVQLLIQKIENPEIVEVKKMSQTKRGAGGFGSTGK